MKTAPSGQSIKLTLTPAEQTLILAGLADFSRRSTDKEILFQIDELVRKIKAKQ